MDAARAPVWRTKREHGVGERQRHAGGGADATPERALTVSRARFGRAHVDELRGSARGDRRFSQGRHIHDIIVLVPAISAAGWRWKLANGLAMRRRDSCMASSAMRHAFWLAGLAACAVLGCSDDVDLPQQTDAASDGGPSSLDVSPTDGAESPVRCTARALCRVSAQGAWLSVAPVTIPHFCTRERFPSSPSAGVYPVCLVDPQGNAHLTYLGGSELLEMPGWTHDAYGGVVIPSTLSAAGEVLCARVRMSLAPNQCPASDAGLDGSV